MRIKSVHISGIGGIKDITLRLNPSLNVICGPNGIGKTTVLKVIADAFSSNSADVKRNVLCEKGKYEIIFEGSSGQEVQRLADIRAFAPDDFDNNSIYDKDVLYVMYFTDTRDIGYEKLNSVPRDSDRGSYRVNQKIAHGIGVRDMKGWFVNRFLFEGHEEALSEGQLLNFEVAKNAFSVLDASVRFKTVDPKSLDIIVSTANGDIFFEYLSAGYKSCLYLILGLIKEIEFRLGGQSITAREYDGVVLIDEIDLHLHPTWQAKLISALRDIFPSAQFIVTTHSPSVLQSLTKDEIIPLTSDEAGNVSVRDLRLTEYGLQGWTVEEILRDVMEMPGTTSQVYENARASFDSAMDKGDVEGIRASYAVLKRMLHPDSVVLRLLDIQAASWLDER